MLSALLKLCLLLGASSAARVEKRCVVKAVRQRSNQHLIGKQGTTSGSSRSCWGCGSYRRYGSCEGLIIPGVHTYSHPYLFCTSDLDCGSQGAFVASVDDDDVTSTKALYNDNFHSDSDKTHSDSEVKPWYTQASNWADENQEYVIIGAIAVFLACSILCLFCRASAASKTKRRQREVAQARASRTRTRTSARNGRTSNNDGPPLAVYLAHSSPITRLSQSLARSSAPPPPSTQVLSPATVRDLEAMEAGTRSGGGRVVAQATAVSVPISVPISVASTAGLSVNSTGNARSSGTNASNSVSRGAHTGPVAMALVLRESEQLAPHQVPVAEAVPMLGAVVVSNSNSSTIAIV